MSFEAATAHLDALGVDAMRATAPSLHRMEAVCALLDHPERGLQGIHIAGTNGKTSTARIATGILEAAGLSVGTFTSPHLVDVTERLALNGAPLGRDDFGSVWSHLRPYLEQVERDLGERLTYFEVLTAMFYLWAAEAVDAVVVETGLGGRWDATNVWPAPVSVITSVGLDHTDLLGNDPVGIAREKAGIAARDSVVVSGVRLPNLAQAVAEQAEEAGARVVMIGDDFDVGVDRLALGGRVATFRTSQRTYDDLFVPLHGRHQTTNALLALEAVAQLLPEGSLDADVAAAGLADVTVPGRFALHQIGGTRIVLDVAHNPDGMSALVTTLAETLPFERVIFVAAFLDDKDVEGMVVEMARLPAQIVATEPGSPRAAPRARVAAAARSAGLDVRAVADARAAFDESVAAAGSDDVVCVTGSHYLVGLLLPYLVQPRT